MALPEFKNEIMAPMILANLNKESVFAQICDRKYEGTIARLGDTVRIVNIGAVTVFDYTSNTDMPAPEVILDGARILTIDQAKGFNVQLDDIDAAQGADGVMAEVAREASYALMDTQDRYLAALWSDADSGNLVGSTGTPKTISASTDLYGWLVDLGVKLQEANNKMTGAWVVLPPWAHGVLLKDVNFVGTGGLRAEEILGAGFIGRCAGLNIFISNNVVDAGSGKYKVIAGVPGAITLANQVAETESYRPEKRFADAVKGLLLYGAKVVRPKSIAVLTVTKPS